MIIRGVAFDHVAEMLLGIDWLETNGVVWRGELFMYGLVHVLKPKTNDGWVRWIVVQETVQLPARGETDEAGRMVNNDLKNSWVTWASVPGSPLKKFELRVPYSHPVTRESRCA